MWLKMFKSLATHMATNITCVSDAIVNGNLKMAVANPIKASVIIFYLPHIFFGENL